MTRYVCNNCQVTGADGPCEFDDHDAPSDARPLPPDCPWRGCVAKWEKMPGDIKTVGIANPDTPPRPPSIWIEIPLEAIAYVEVGRANSMVHIRPGRCPWHEDRIPVPPATAQKAINLLNDERNRAETSTSVPGTTIGTVTDTKADPCTGGPLWPWGDAG